MLPASESFVFEIHASPCMKTKRMYDVTQGHATESAAQTPIKAARLLSTLRFENLPVHQDIRQWRASLHRVTLTQAAAQFPMLDVQNVCNLVKRRLSHCKKINN